ncbi:hypothetical protein Fmac_020388 [Flemingia macrophylla]|uniref:Uncharacterized protein n=1 Tax=Flemingia macrophylla TaxID=520843 RepID=A0ABD1LU35_9FABA
MLNPRFVQDDRSFQSQLVMVLDMFGLGMKHWMSMFGQRGSRMLLKRMAYSEIFFILDDGKVIKTTTIMPCDREWGWLLGVGGARRKSVVSELLWGTLSAESLLGPCGVVTVGRRSRASSPVGSLCEDERCRAGGGEGALVGFAARGRGGGASPVSPGGGRANCKQYATIVTPLIADIPAAPHYDTSHGDTSRNLLVGQNPSLVRTLRSHSQLYWIPLFPVCSGCHMPTSFRLVRPRTTPYWVRGPALIPFVTPLTAYIPAAPHYDTSHGDTSRNLLVGQNPSPVRTLRR